MPNNITIILLNLAKYPPILANSAHGLVCLASGNIVLSEVQMETWDEFLNFISSEIGVHHKKDQIKISQFTKFEFLSLDCNHEEGFQNSEKLETFYGLRGGGGHLGFERPLTSHSLVTMQWHITKLDKLTNFHVIFLAMGFIFLLWLNLNNLQFGITDAFIFDLRSR